MILRSTKELPDVLPLDAVNDAFRRLEHRGVTGKLVLQLRD